MLNLVPCHSDIRSTIFCDTAIITYEIYLHPAGKKIGFNVFSYNDFTMQYIHDKIPNSPDSHKLPTQSKKNVWIVSINGYEYITAIEVFYEIQN